MKKKLWLKSDPSVTAEIEAQYGDDTCALIHNPRIEEGDPHPQDYLGFIKLDEWSDVEMTPVPACADEKLWVAVVGPQDPTDVTYVTFNNEVNLHVAIATRGDILGYFEIDVPASMVPAKLKK